mgnify:CR=1 FL=1|jgi:hypothetical protein
MQGWAVKVIKNDGSEATFPVTPKVIVAFERFHKTGLGKAFTDNQRMEHVYWLGWEAERTAGNTVPVFDTWLESVDAVEVLDGSDPLDASPTAT